TIAYDSRSSRGFAVSQTPLLVRLCQDPEPAVRAAAARALGRVRPDPAVATAALKTILARDEVGPRRAAAQALSDLGGGVPVPAAGWTKGGTKAGGKGMMKGIGKGGANRGMKGGFGKGAEFKGFGGKGGGFSGGFGPRGMGTLNLDAAAAAVSAAGAGLED